MNIINQDISISGETLLIHETEHIFIVIENDIDKININHVYIFDTEGMIDCFSKNNNYLEEFYNSLLEIGYKRYTGVDFPVWFPSKYKTIYKLQMCFPYDLKG